MLSELGKGFYLMFVQNNSLISRTTIIFQYFLNVFKRMILNVILSMLRLKYISYTYS